MDYTVCFTGHRQISDEEYAPLYRVLEQTVLQQIRAGAQTFRTGGAMGFDTMAALCVLSLKKQYPDVRLELILPCPTQTRGWPEAEKCLYRQILEQADAYRYVSQGYYAGVLQMRNRALVEGANVCIAYLRNSQGGGTAFTASLALKRGLELINLKDFFE